MQATLVVVQGDAQAPEFHLSKLPTIIGRSRSADLKLGQPLVSRQHCELFEANGVLMVRDLGSLNGTYVGQTKIAAETMLEPGGLLTIGSVTFRANYEQPAATQSSAASPAAAEGEGGFDFLAAGATAAAAGTTAAAAMDAVEAAFPPAQEPAEAEAGGDDWLSGFGESGEAEQAPAAEMNLDLPAEDPLFADMGEGDASSSSSADAVTIDTNRRDLGTADSEEDGIKLDDLDLGPPAEAPDAAPEVAEQPPADELADFVDAEPAADTELAEAGADATAPEAPAEDDGFNFAPPEDEAVQGDEGEGGGDLDDFFRSLQ